MTLETENPRICTRRLVLRPPRSTDFEAWRTLRDQSADFLMPWEPAWAPDHLDRDTFLDRIENDAMQITAGTALPLFLCCRSSGTLFGELTLNNIRKGPHRDGSVGYWIGETFARRGFMREALSALVGHAFQTLDISRIQAACLPGNVASRGLLETSDFAREGVARNYMQIAGKWRDHVIYASLRRDRKRRSGP